jgi:ribose transport system substrate-binding protein
MRRKSLCAVLAAVMLLALLPAMLFAGGSGEKGKKITIGMPLYNQQHEFWQNIYNTAKSYAAEKGITLIAVDSNYDAAKQVSIMEDMLTKKVDALILGAVDPSGVLPTVDEYVKAGIPVVAVDNPLERGVVTFVGIDNKQGGVMGGEWAGRYIKDKLGGKANIALIDYPIEQACIDRADGFLEGVKKYAPDVQVVSRLDGSAVRDKAMTVMEDIIQAHPEVNVVFGINDDSALGALAAMEAAGKTKDNELIVGFDGTVDAREAIKRGSILKADVMQDPVAFAKAAIDAALKALKGEKLPANTITATKVLDASNVK